MPKGGDKQATAAHFPRSLGGGDKLRSIVGPVAQTLVVGKDPPKLRIIVVALVDQYTDKLCLDKRVVPLPTRADALAQKRRDRRLEASVVATVGAAVVPAIGEFAFGGQ